MKRILSSVLCAIMVFTIVIAALPTRSYAAYSPITNAATSDVFTSSHYSALYTLEGDEELGIQGIYSYNFNNAEEMLNYEKSKGYISSLQLGDYTLYVNKYTGYIYYQNNVTKQILTSNPYDIGYLNKKPGDGDINMLTSQLVINFKQTATNEKDTYASSQWAGERGQISVSYIKNGFRVNYTLGDTSSRLIPIAVKADKFEEEILLPMLETYQALLGAFVEGNPRLEGEDYILIEEGKEKYQGLTVKTASGYLNTNTILEYIAITKKNIINKIDASLQTSENYLNLNALNIALNQLFGQKGYSLLDTGSDIEKYNEYKEKGYTNKDPIMEGLIKSISDNFKRYPITGKWDGAVDPNTGVPTKDGTEAVVGTQIYVLNDPELEKNEGLRARNFSNLFKKYTAYSTIDILQDENEVGVKAGAVSKPAFRCSLEYTLNQDGTLDITLPASSISFDESIYTLESIIPIQYFGCGVKNDSKGNPKGYKASAFIPDGSGSITNFSEFTTVSYSAPIYGTDYAYSTLESKFEYCEPITMPVYGMVTDTASNENHELTVKNGYVAIIKEGSALARINMIASEVGNKYVNTYLSYTPYPSDTFDLTESITVGNVTDLTLTLDSKYAGSYVTNITMLTDPDIKAAKAPLDYEATYSGMAARYRDYLVDNGTLEKLQNVDNGNMPLYIETLGSIEVIKKYLTFPVNVNIPLTSFDDILTMYNELKDAKNTLLKKAEAYREQGENAPKDDVAQREFCEKKALEYIELANEIEKNITNVNFKLTGFANNGMDYTYPTKVKWEKACGGKRGFSDLVGEAAEISKTEGQHLGIYPDFDFMFLMNNDIFSAVKRWDKVRMIDNRYASRQVYDPASREYIKGFGNIINTASLDKFFSKFEDSYSDYEWKYISLSTFGTVLNSNFDEDDPINRDTSLKYVTSILETAQDKGYSLMVDKGNAYTYEYIDHIVDLSIDSSHNVYSSYTVPFVGMVLHGYINYAGNAINYSGSEQYDILKSIENGANLYYTLCYQNTSLMKDSEIVNSYYSVNYDTWFERMVKTYNTLNKQIGNLQDYTIIEHKTIIGEKKLTSSELEKNADLIKAEFTELLNSELRALINNKIDELGVGSNPSIKLDIDVDALCAQLMAITSLPAEYLDSAKDAENNDVAGSIDLRTVIGEVVEEVKAYFGSVINDDETTNVISLSAITEYTSKYDYFTKSLATDKNYDTTFYSVNNYNVVMVTYAKYDADGNITDTVSFVLNYNIDAVTVDLGTGEPVVLEKYAFSKV